MMDRSFLAFKSIARAIVFALAPRLFYRPVLPGPFINDFSPREGRPLCQAHKLISSRALNRRTSLGCLVNLSEFNG